MASVGNLIETCVRSDDGLVETELAAISRLRTERAARRYSDFGCGKFAFAELWSDFSGVAQDYLKVI